MLCGACRAEKKKDDDNQAVLVNGTVCAGCGYVFVITDNGTGVSYWREPTGMEMVKRSIDDAKQSQALGTACGREEVLH